MEAEILKAGQCLPQQVTLRDQRIGDFQKDKGDKQSNAHLTPDLKAGARMVS